MLVDSELTNSKKHVLLGQGWGWRDFFRTLLCWGFPFSECLGMTWCGLAAFALMQAGKCVRPTFGGPIKDPCTGALPKATDLHNIDCLM